MNGCNRLPLYGNTLPPVERVRDPKSGKPRESRDRKGRKPLERQQPEREEKYHHRQCRADRKQHHKFSNLSARHDMQTPTLLCPSLTPMHNTASAVVARWDSYGLMGETLALEFLTCCGSDACF